MSTAPRGSTEHQRAVRRRHLHERQAVIFGTLITALAAAALLGLGVYLRVIPAPFDVPLSTPAAVDAASSQPCPPDGALPVEYGQITVNVYNGTRRPGLAAATAAELAGRGLVIGQQANDPRGRYGGVVLIRTGQAGVPAAYTVAAMFPGAIVSLDTRGDATIDVTLGSDFEAIAPLEESRLDPATPLTGPEGCAPLTTPTATPTA